MTLYTINLKGVEHQLNLFIWEIYFQWLWTNFLDMFPELVKINNAMHNHVKRLIIQKYVFINTQKLYWIT